MGHALRVLQRAPGFAASTAIFTVVDAVLPRPLRFAQPERLVMIQPTSGSRLSPSLSPRMASRESRLRGIAGWDDVRMNLTGHDRPRDVLVDRVTADFFEMLGTPAIVGRTFTPGTDLSHVEPEVVLSHGFWQRHYGGDRASD